MTRRRATLAEIAQAAGVSVATVSKVLNGRGDVGGETRHRVEKQLREFSYRRAGDERARVRNQGLQVGLLIEGLQDAYGSTVSDGILDAAHEENISLVIGRYADWLDPKRLLKSTLAGMITLTADATSSTFATLDQAGFPVVVVDPFKAQGAHCMTIGTTNFQGGVSATEHLISLGHRRVGHAGGPETMDCSNARVAGYTSALRRAGLDVDESLVTYCQERHSYDEGRRAAARLLDRPDPPSAVFAGSDEIALGIMEEARCRGIRVPEQLSVVGFDNTFLAERATPQLTTVAQPLFEMGRLGLKTLCQLIDGTPSEVSHIELATSLVIRDSTSPVP